LLACFYIGFIKLTKNNKTIIPARAANLNFILKIEILRNLIVFRILFYS